MGGQDAQMDVTGALTILNPTMSKKSPAPVKYVPPHRYKSPNVPMAAIKRFARQIAEKFQPEKIILFGSYAYGTPHEESDVDILVIMPCRNELDQAVRIDGAFDERPFSLDLIVRTPFHMHQGLKDPNDRDWFLYEIREKGKVLYEAPHRPMGSEGRGGHGSGKKRSRRAKPAPKRRVLPLPAND
jgi:predicted nucleotidyltransferase